MPRKVGKRRAAEHARRERVRVVRGGGEAALRELRKGVVKPLSVGAIRVQDFDAANSEALAMTVTIDPRSTVGLDAVFNETKQRTFDVLTSWQVLVDDEPQVPALAFLRIKIPERSIDFAIEFVVDELRRSLTAATQTKLVYLVEPALSRAATTGPVPEAMERYRWLGVEASYTEPIVPALEQRFDVPAAGPVAERFEIDPADREDWVDAFAHGVRGLSEYAVEAPIVGPATIHLVDDSEDPELAHLISEQPDTQGFAAGRWSVMAGTDGGVARFDLITAELGRSWVIMNPDQRVVRAAASGAHIVAIGNQRIVDVGEAQQRDAIPIALPASEAMRALIR